MLGIESSVLQPRTEISHQPEMQVNRRRAVTFSGKFGREPGRMVGHRPGNPRYQTIERGHDDLRA
jgi:hypothetical protein